jgi:glycosyltransferase involved in cell wall biosynthesis
MLPSNPGYIAARQPDLSIIMPCYNEEAIIPFTIPRLLNAFHSAGYRLQLIAVDNGSWDRTGEIIQRLAAANPAIVHHRVEVNRGYGNGLLAGIPRCTAPWVGILPADGQVDAEDVVRLYETVIAAGRPVVGKVRRRFRMDGLQRKVFSTAYNVLARLLWPTLDSLDLNGNPKLLPRDLLLRMNLESRDWFLDAEILLKAHYMGVPCLELNVFARVRSSGMSQVRPSTCLQFLKNLLRYRFSGGWRAGLPRRYAPGDGAVHQTPAPASQRQSA